MLQLAQLLGSARRWGAPVPQQTGGLNPFTWCPRCDWGRAGLHEHPEGTQLHEAHSQTPALTPGHGLKGR